MPLQNCKGQPDDIHDARGLAVAGCFQEHGNHDIGAHDAHGIHRNGSGQKSVHECVSLEFHGHKHSGIRAGSAQRGPQRSMREIGGFARSQVGRRDDQRDLQFLKRAHAEKLPGVVFQPLVGSKPQPGKFPAAKILEPCGLGLLHDFVNRVAAGVGDGQHRSGAGSSQEIDGNMRTLQHAQHAQVRDSAREAATQRNANARALRRPLLGLGVGKITNAFDRVLQPFRRFLFLALFHFR